MPKVSFILPAYKRAFLKEAIDSVLAQTCRDFELVVVDDKSPEKLYEVIKEYPWEKDFTALPDGGRKWIVDGVPVRYYENPENIGGKDLVAAWNHAMEYAMGEWCVLASDDDVYRSEYLQEMLCLQCKYPQCDVFHCRIKAIDGSGNTLWVGEARDEFETPAAMLYNTAVRRIAIRASDVMFRKARWKERGGFYQSRRAWFSDIGSWISIASEFGACCSPKILFYWRESGVNISNVHNDLKEKTIAGFEFLSWAHALIANVKAGSSEDAKCLHGAEIEIDGVTCSLMRYVAKRAPLRALLETLASVEIPLMFKLRLIKDRLYI